MKVQGKYQRTIMIILMTLFSVYSCQRGNKEKAAADKTNLSRDSLSQKSKMPDSANLENGIQVAMFIEQTGLGAMLEMAMAKLAADKAQDSPIKDFANRMTQQYTKLNLELSALAAVKGLRLPGSLQQKQQRQIREMSAMKNEYFEKLYLKIVIEEQNKYIELFKGALSGPDGQVGDFSRKFLPVLESQRQKAYELLSTLN